jgi:excisionase family DNA binding protein
LLTEAKEPETPCLALSPNAAAAACSISLRTISAWLKNEGLPHVRLNRRILIPVDGLRRWLEQKSIVSTKPLDDSNPL